eukprot:TRINITY_DN3930_c0_g2_i3.p1 TRINITY_DN3930_c0_g2~~TRINITY_DN3930_c0_g2_i3.p1  ORF type:complete len:200 (-),score=15.47 TRINITY_DN3930_c0_g2_i3:112-711(-)
MVMNELLSTSYVIYHRLNVNEELVRRIDMALINNGVYQNQKKLYQQYLDEAKLTKCAKKESLAENYYTSADFDYLMYVYGGCLVFALIYFISMLGAKQYFSRLKFSGTAAELHYQIFERLRLSANHQTSDSITRIKARVGRFVKPVQDVAEFKRRKARLKVDRFIPLSDLDFKEDSPTKKLAKRFSKGFIQMLKGVKSS